MHWLKGLLVLIVLSVASATGLPLLTTSEPPPLEVVLPSPPLLELLPPPLEVKQLPAVPPVIGGSVKLPTENDALALAATDLATLTPEDRYYIRYVWIEEGHAEDALAAQIVLQHLSKGTSIIPSKLQGKDALMLLRVDLRCISRESTLHGLIATWEKFRFEPRLNLLFTKDTLAFNFGVTVVKQKRREVKIVDDYDNLIKVPEYTHTDGKKYTAKYGKKEIVTYVDVDPLSNGEDVIPQISEQIDKRLWEYLVDNTQSQAPVVTLSYLTSRGLSQIQNADPKNNGFQTIYGGLYYEFKNIRRGFKKGTDEDNFLETLGVGNVAQGLTANRVFDLLRSDARVVIQFSKVTGRTRRVDVFRTLAGQINDVTSICSFTHDTNDAHIDRGTDPWMNLLEFQDDAREVIAEDANGFPIFVLFNGQGVLQDFVPDNVTSDARIPAPYRQTLQPGISCLRCHIDGSGWQALSNDVRKVLGGMFDVFDDISKRQSLPRDQFDKVDRVIGLYRGEPELVALPRARNDLQRMYVKAIGGGWPKEPNLTLITKNGGERIAEIYARYNYRRMSAVDVLKNLGLEVSRDMTPAQAGEVLKKIIPPLPRPVVYGVIPEDPWIIVLKEGQTLQRSQFDAVYSFLASRYNAAMKANPN